VVRDLVAEVADHVRPLAKALAVGAICGEDPIVGAERDGRTL